MIISMNRTGISSAARHETRKPQQNAANSDGLAAANVGIDICDHCSEIRQSIRSMLKLASEIAFDLWSGYTRSAYLEKFEVTYHDQLEALEAVQHAESQADLRLLTRKAESALIAFADAVQREIIVAVGPEMTETDFRDMFGRVKDCAVTASESVGSIQRAATGR